jgi:hypothetical protein
LTEWLSRAKRPARWPGGAISTSTERVRLMLQWAGGQVGSGSDRGRPAGRAPPVWVALSSALRTRRERREGYGIPITALLQRAWHAQTMQRGKQSRSETAGRNGSVQVLLLGPVGVRYREQWVAPPSGPMRALLAALALADGGEMTHTALVEGVWRQRSLASPQSTVAVAVHRLRRWLQDSVGEAATVTRATTGYVLDLKAGGTDVAQFRTLVAAAQRRDAVGCIEVLDQALGLWRGPALSDVPSSYADEAIAARLES